MAVTSPAPDQPLRALYEDPAVPLSSGPDRARRQARLLAGIIRERTGPAVILDVGCGDGSALAVAVQAVAVQAVAGSGDAGSGGAEPAGVAGPHAGHRFAGIDWSASAVGRAHGRGLTVVRGGVTAPGLPIADGAADVVIMSELIEHLVDPDRAVEEARRVLRPGGSLLLSTPNLAAWYNRGLLAAGIQPVFSEVSLRGVFGRPGRVVAGHLRLFTRRALTQFLAANGFRCVSVSGAAYHDVPRPLRGLDRLACRWPSVASILLVHARKD